MTSLQWIIEGIFNHYVKTRVTFTVGPYYLRACKFQARTRPGPQNIIESRPGPARPVQDPNVYIAPIATAGWQVRPGTTLPTTLDYDLQGVGIRFRNKQDFQHLRTFASDRNQWRNLSQEIMKVAQAKLTHSQ